MCAQKNILLFSILLAEVTGNKIFSRKTTQIFEEKTLILSIQPQFGLAVSPAIGNISYVDIIIYQGYTGLPEKDETVKATYTVVVVYINTIKTTFYFDFDFYQPFQQCRNAET